MTQNNQKNILLGMLLLFFVVYTTCAVLLQIRSGELPSKSAAAVDMFTGGLFWVMSIVGILMAAIRSKTIMKAVIWLGVSAGCGALAIDEIFEFHEATRHVVGDDDYIKIATLPIALIGLYILYRIEKPTQRVIAFFLVGLGFHVLYIVSDMGDGDFFQLPIPEIILLWTEEMLELLALQSYLTGFLLHYTIISNSCTSSKDSGLKAS
jgi:hypothetical protein